MNKYAKIIRSNIILAVLNLGKRDYLTSRVSPLLILAMAFFLSGSDCFSQGGWDKLTIGTPGSKGYTVTSDANGITYVGGSKYSDYTGSDFFIVCVDRGWEKCISSDGKAVDTCIAIDSYSNGDLVATGVMKSKWVVMKMNTKGILQWTTYPAKKGRPRDICSISDGSCIVGGEVYNEDLQSMPIIVKLAKDGTVIWNSPLDKNLFLRNLTLTPQGEVYFTAKSSDYPLFVFGKLSPSGEVLWIKKLSDGLDNENLPIFIRPNSLILHKDRFYVAGESYRPMGAIWLGVISKQGELYSGNILEGIVGRPNGLCIANDDNSIVVTGSGCATNERSKSGCLLAEFNLDTLQLNWVHVQPNMNWGTDMSILNDGYVVVGVANESAMGGSSRMVVYKSDLKGNAPIIESNQTLQDEHQKAQDELIKVFRTLQINEELNK